MNEIEKLDNTLIYINENDIPDKLLKVGVISSGMIEKHIELKDTNFAHEAHAIIDKLEKDGYIDKKYISGPNITICSITFEGRYFIKYLGGYQGLHLQKTAQIQESKERERRVLALETFQQEQAKRLNKLTLLAVIGTGALVLWEVLKYFVFEHHWYLYSP